MMDKNEIMKCRIRLACDEAKERHGVRIISECAEVNDVFGEVYYEIGVHINDMCRGGFDVVEKCLRDEFGGTNIKVGYDNMRNKICVKV